MRDLKGKTAYVSGAAAGIGFGIARELARVGMNVAISDVDRDTLKNAKGELEALGGGVMALEVDAADRTAVRQAASRIEERFGSFHVLVNNAGVGFAGVRLDEVRDEDWDWVIGVNINGFINAGQAFLPLIKKHGAGGHVVNVASMSGLRVNPKFAQGVYSTTKYALVGYSEALEQDLAPHNIGVSVLCPGGVNTNIFQAGRARPEKYGGPYFRDENHPLAQYAATGMSIEAVGRRVRRAIEEGEFYILTHPEQRVAVEERHRRLMAAFDLTEELRAKGEE